MPAKTEQRHHDATHPIPALLHRQVSLSHRHLRTHIHIQQLSNSGQMIHCCLQYNPNPCGRFLPHYNLLTACMGYQSQGFLDVYSVTCLTDMKASSPHIPSSLPKPLFCRTHQETSPIKHCAACLPV